MRTSSNRRIPIVPTCPGSLLVYLLGGQANIAFSLPNLVTGRKKQRANLPRVLDASKDWMTFTGQTASTRELRPSAQLSACIGKLSCCRLCVVKFALQISPAFVSNRSKCLETGMHLVVIYKLHCCSPVEPRNTELRVRTWS